jgi:hypothetical protein
MNGKLEKVVVSLEEPSLAMTKCFKIEATWALDKAIDILHQ